MRQSPPNAVITVREVIAAESHIIARAVHLDHKILTILKRDLGWHPFERNIRQNYCLVTPDVKHFILAFGSSWFPKHNR